MILESVMKPGEVFMSGVKNVLSCEWKAYLGCSSEEVYYGNLIDVFILLCAGVSVYLVSYEDVDSYGEYDSEFLYYVWLLMHKIKWRCGWYEFIELYGTKLNGWNNTQSFLM